MPENSSNCQKKPKAEGRASRGCYEPDLAPSYQLTTRPWAYLDFATI